MRIELERLRRYAACRRAARTFGPGGACTTTAANLEIRKKVTQADGVTVEERPLDLTPSEFGLLESLIRQPGRVFSRAELIDSALGGDSLVLERTIDVHIRSLRKKLGPHAVLVETVRGIGYRFRDPASVD